MWDNTMIDSSSASQRIAFISECILVLERKLKAEIWNLGKFSYKQRRPRQTKNSQQEQA
jgi:nucleoid DNA-binding protein